MATTAKATMAMGSNLSLSFMAGNYGWMCKSTQFYVNTQKKPTFITHATTSFAKKSAAHLHVAYARKRQMNKKTTQHSDRKWHEVC